MIDNKRKKSKREETKKNKNFNNILINFIKKLSIYSVYNNIVFFVILISSCFVFLKYPVQFFPDSETYYVNAKIILGLMPFSEWFSVRGYGFPLVIASWIKMFGDNHNAFIYGSLFIYLIFIFLVGRIVQHYIKKNQVRNYSLFVILYVLLIQFNTLILGYNHTLLTESIMPLLFLLFVLNCMSWYNKTFESNKKSIIINNVFFNVLTIFIWFVKQPYIPAVLATYLVTAVISGLYFKSKKVLLQKLSSFAICFVVLIISINIWNVFLFAMSGKSSNDTNNIYMSSALLGGINVYYYGLDKDVYCNNSFINESNLKKNDKKMLNNYIQKNENDWCDDVVIFDIKDNLSNHISYDYIITKNGKIGIMNSASFLIKQFLTHPSLVIKSYFYNYLAIADIQERYVDNGYRSSTVFSSSVVGENLTNGTIAFVSNHNNILLNGNYDNVVSWGGEHKIITPLLNINLSLCFYLFKVLTVIIIYIFIKYLILFIRNKKSIDLFIALLSSVHVFNTLFHVVVGAIIDRYIYSSYTLAVIALILILINLSNCGGKKYERKSTIRNSSI